MAGLGYLETMPFTLTNEKALSADAQAFAPEVAGAGGKCVPARASCIPSPLQFRFSVPF